MTQHAEELKEQYGIKVHVIPQDLSIPSSADILFSKVKSLRLSVDYLVNNAGFGDNGEFVESNLPRQEEMINLNILTLTKLTHLFGADMKKKKQGNIMNVASTAAFIPGPLMAVYFATKHFVLSFSEGIAEELRPYNVYVSTLCPGPTQTEFGEVAGFGRVVPSDSSPYPLAAEVAQFGYKKMKSREVVFIEGFKNKLNAFGARFLPRSTVRKMVHRSMK